MNECQIEAAEASVERERTSLADRASAAISGTGSDECNTCGEEISPERRAAAPFAQRCLACQNHAEQRARRYAR